MIPSLLFLMAFQGGDKEALLLLEEVSIKMPGGFVEQYRRNIWIGKSRIRVDIEDKSLSMIVDDGRKTMYVLDHLEGQYYIVLAGRNNALSRPPFFALTSVEDGKLPRTSPLVVSTNQQEKISGWECTGYRLNYPKQFGIETVLWRTTHKTLLTRADMKRLWFAFIGPEPPRDVKWAVNQILSELDGIPIRITSTLAQEEMVITFTSTIVFIQKQVNIDPEFFSEPKNYKIAQWAQDNGPLVDR